MNLRLESHKVEQKPCVEPSSHIPSVVKYVWLLSDSRLTYNIIGLLVCGPVTSVLYTLLMRFVNNKVKEKNIPNEKYAMIKKNSESHEAKTKKSENKKLKEIISGLKKKIK